MKTTKAKLIRNFSLLLVCFLPTACGVRENDTRQFVAENTAYAGKQTTYLLNTLGAPDGTNYPRTLTPEKGLVTTTENDWTPGFFPGSLWYLYELTGDTCWRNRAEAWTYPLEKMKTFTGNHDIGFVLYCSYGNALRLAPRPGYQEILITAARSLCTRFDEKVQAIRSWNYRQGWDGSEWFYPVIIDNMMNLELLLYAYKATGDRTYYDVATAHANTTLKNHFRADGSSYHVVNYDPATGLVLHRATCQGYSDNSTWARGQAWAIYGYTMMYRETGIRTYLDAARKFTGYYLSRLPDDCVPWWDFDAGQDGYIPQGDSYALRSDKLVKDASAAAIVCSALFELGELANEKAYIQAAERMLRTLASPEYRAPESENGGFLLRHCTGSFPHRSEIDVPLVYADYYFLEALIRYKRYRKQH